MNPNEIYIEIKSNYGNEAIYPACDNARKFAKLTGKKTFSHLDLTVIEALGFCIVTKKQELKRA